jgi:hypothetical protein
MLTVSEGARGLEEAAACDLPVSTQLSLKLHLVLLYEVCVILIAFEMPLWPLDSG